ncbi:MAG: hypothetical protein SP1CHLAM54_14930 [Chlamydiia bacterium]|nr:hypothetical protein [Chlamydiia bacterium]MCH9616383.1 hypothetical protein [Chlamydiia bacterium]MCH9629631.1 hypothetical protein [Chlamydiia bacterium]
MDMKRHFTLNRKLLFVLAVIPVVFYGMNYSTRLDSAKQKLLELQAVQTKTKQVKRLLLDSNEEQYMDANHHYIETVLEQFEPLKEEGALLTRFKEDPLLQTTKALASELSRLKSNKLQFGEVSRKRFGGYVDLEVKLMQPVCLSTADLKDLLLLIENVPIEGHEGAPNPPFLAIKRSAIYQKDTHLELDLTLIKREKYENAL